MDLLFMKEWFSLFKSDLLQISSVHNFSLFLCPKQKTNRSSSFFTLFVKDDIRSHNSFKRVTRENCFIALYKKSDENDSHFKKSESHFRSKEKSNLHAKPGLGFALLLFVFHSKSLRLKSHCEQFALVTLYKRVTVSKSLRLLMTKEQLWVNRSHRSSKWAILSDISDLLVI